MDRFIAFNLITGECVFAPTRALFRRQLAQAQASNRRYGVRSAWVFNNPWA